MNSKFVTENNIYAESLFHIGSFGVTNALLTTWIVVFLVVILALYFKKKGYSLIPGRLQILMEMGLDQIKEYVSTATGSEERTKKIFPIVFAMFIFILFNNFLGLIPGFGVIGYLQNGQEINVLTPYLRTGTADLNTTMALALFSVIASNLFGLFTIGIWKTINRFINIDEGLFQPFYKFGKNPDSLPLIPRIQAFFMDMFVGFIKLVIGLMDIIGELAKIISLSFRLFGNMYAGQILLSSMAALFAFFVPIPFYFTSIIAAFVQALVFSMLTMVYFSLASEVDPT